MISTTGTATSGSIMIRESFPTGCAQRDVSAQTIMSRKHTLKSSDGCTESGPKTTHRRAPDTVRPSAKTEASPASPTT